jgi:uncharacterized protein YrrD
MRTSALQGMPVLSLADGARVGNVKEILFDSAHLRVTGLLLAASGGPSVLPFANIRSIGADAVTIESTAATEGVTGRGATSGLRDLREVTGLPVSSSEGTHLGDVRDVEVAPEDGRLVELVVHKGGVLGLGGTTLTVPAAAIRSIGPKLVTVDLPPADPAAPRP